MPPESHHEGSVEEKLSELEDESVERKMHLYTVRETHTFNEIE
jgi:hypothetical protein